MLITDLFYYQNVFSYVTEYLGKPKTFNYGLHSDLNFPESKVPIYYLRPLLLKSLPLIHRLHVLQPFQLFFIIFACLIQEVSQFFVKGSSLLVFCPLQLVNKLRVIPNLESSTMLVVLH